MNLISLELFHFRNYEKQSFSFEENCIHCLCGKNAQGKTNLIESIYFLSYLHSFRTRQVSSMVQNDNDFFKIHGLVENKQRKEDLKIVVSEKKKYLYRYQNPVNRFSDFVGIVNAVLFCPDDMIIFQSPKQRRHLIDMELIKLSKTYTSTLSAYQKLLKERNFALKSHQIDSILIQTYTEQIIEQQQIIIRQRSHFVKDLVDKAKSLYPLFSSGNENIDAYYRTFIEIDDSMKQSLIEAYEKSYEKDVRYKQTTMGIHKDDIVFLLNGKEMDQVASQGQKRSFLLALKLALCQIIYEKSNQYPILLLDDVFSELDDFRKKSLIQSLPKEMQIFITTTEELDKSWFSNRKSHIYNVEKGTIKEVAE